jgi:DNA repair exonuclease SbcCD nuclease subunit
MAADQAGTGPSGTIPGYIDLDVPALDRPLRVFGLEYRGGYIDTALEDAAEAIPAINDRDGQPGATLLMAHFGVADEVPDLGAAVSYPELAPLEEIVDYLALGHIHKPYEGPDEGGPDRPNWYFNPGALEAHDTREATWPLGYYETTVTPDGLNATHQQSKRRPFYRLRFDVDEYDTWPALRDGFEAHLADEQDAIAEQCGKTIHRAGGNPRDPVIDLRVDGHLSFDRRDLDVDALEQLVEAATGALHVQTQVSVTTADILDLIEDLDEDASDAEAMAETLGRAKELVMTDGADGETVADFLRKQRRQAFAGGVGDVEHDYSETAETADSGGVDDEKFRAVHAGETVDPVEAAARSAQETPDADADDTEANTIDGGSDTDTTSTDTTPGGDGETAGQAQLTDVTGEGDTTEGED